MANIVIGNITIEHVGQKQFMNGENVDSYKVTSPRRRGHCMVHTNDIRAAVLEALAYDELGLNSEFGYFAGKMLGINDAVWVGA